MGTRKSESVDRRSIAVQTYELWQLDKLDGGSAEVRAMMLRRLATMHHAAEAMLARAAADSAPLSPRSRR